MTSRDLTNSSDPGRSLSEFCFDLIAATLPARPADPDTPSNVVPFPSRPRSVLMSGSVTVDLAVTLPPGVRHHNTSAIAESWDVYNALTAADGWTEARWVVGMDDDLSFHMQKEIEVDGNHFTVYAPHDGRPTPCLECAGRGCSEPDPDSGQTDPCDACEATGIEGGVAS